MVLDADHGAPARAGKGGAATGNPMCWSLPAAGPVREIVCVQGGWLANAPAASASACEAREKRAKKMGSTTLKVPESSLTSVLVEPVVA